MEDVGWMDLEAGSREEMIKRVHGTMQADKGGAGDWEE